MTSLLFRLALKVNLLSSTDVLTFNNCQLRWPSIFLLVNYIYLTLHPNAILHFIIYIIISQKRVLHLNFQLATQNIHVTTPERLNLQADHTWHLLGIHCSLLVCH